MKSLSLIVGVGLALTSVEANVAPLTSSLLTDSDAIMDAVGEGVATISFNRPDKLNALTPVMLQKFFAKVDAD